MTLRTSADLWPWTGVSPLLLLLAVFFLWPVASLLALSFGSDSGPAEHYMRIMDVAVYRRVLFNTFGIALLVTLLAIVLSYPLAYLLATVTTNTRKLLFVLVLLPFWTSALVRTTAWIVILQRNGLVNELLTSAGLVDEPVAFIYNLSGVLIGMTHVLMPFVVLPLYAAFRAVDRSLIQAAEGLGAGASAVGRRIIFPLTLPGVIAGGTIVFMSAIGYYITPALMGGPGQQMIAMLIADNINRTLNWGLAAALSVVLLVATLVVFTFFQRAFGVDRLLGGGGSRGVSATLGSGLGRRSSGGKATAVAGVLVLAFLLAPIVIVFPMSLGASPFLEFPPESYSLQWFERFFTERRWLIGVWNSVQAAAIAIGISVPLGTLAALGVDRMTLRMRPWIEGLFILPLVVPVIILAVGLFYRLSPLNALGSPLTLGVAHSVIASPFVFITVRSALKGFDRNQELAALSLGASWPTMFRRIMLPAIAPGILAGAVFAFIQSFDDVVLALFLTNVQSRTLPRIMYEGIAHEIDPTIIAVSVLVILVSIAMLCVNLFLTRRSS